MKNFKLASSVIVTVLFSTLAACSSTPTHESTGQYVDDTVITTNVKAAILGEPSLKVAEITVKTYKGEVQLSGFVGSVDNIRTAIAVAEKIDGVKLVKNEMTLK
ncbi:BON domain-containing protein [Solimicrobium silvestre]|uniref:BON domain n=1 Tax=Solimicrobium silvestre TaxID=2099400 RepID=A0A2S9GWS4_9BURK|nr:BON domain-containing protein [Solimicrobium silvestre]PRC92169.1 BON domain [Solimicrobium silvestre]